MIRFSSSVFVVIAVIGAGCSSGGGLAEPGDGGGADGGASAAPESVTCPRDLSGTYRVVSVTRDPGGCDAGEPEPPKHPQYFAVQPGADGRQDVFTCGDPDAGPCDLKSTELPSLTMPGDDGSCVGVGGKSVVFEGAGRTRCIQHVARLTVSGSDPVIFVQESFEFAEDGDSTGACPDHSDWFHGENLPECLPATRSTVERVR